MMAATFCRGGRTVGGGMEAGCATTARLAVPLIGFSIGTFGLIWFGITSFGMEVAGPIEVAIEVGGPC